MADFARLHHDALWLFDFLVFSAAYWVFLLSSPALAAACRLATLPAACAFAFCAACLCRNNALLARETLATASCQLTPVLLRPAILLIGNLTLLPAAAPISTSNAMTVCAALALCFIWPVMTRAALTLFCRRLAHDGAMNDTILLVGSHQALMHARKLTRASDTIIELEHEGELDEPANDASGDSMRERLTQALGVEPAEMRLDMIVFAEDPGADTTPAELIKCLLSLPVRIALLRTAAVDNGNGSEPSEAAPSAGNHAARLRIIAERPIQGWGLLLKAAADRIIAAVLLILFSPLLIGVASVVALDSRGPVLFRQTRTGAGGKPFQIFKFRTMEWTRATSAQTQTSRNDRRITRCGHFLRHSSLDELPQLINVLFGQMSLIGPRPLAETLHGAVLRLKDLNLTFAMRHRVKPGMTGWAQIHGSRGAVDTAEQMQARLQWDLFYVANWSLLIDVLIMLRTPWIVLRGENAF